jgi:predicted nucleic acid-binding protein
MTFADTSGFLAMLAAEDRDHDRALSTWVRLVASEEELVTTNYVLVETISLVQARLGMAAVRQFEADAPPVLRTHWIDAEAHSAAVPALLAANRRQLSLVDCASFDTMRRLGIRRAFTFDAHFAEQGFDVVP